MPKLQSFAEFVDMCLSLTLSTYQNRDEFDSEPWAEKGTGRLINSKLKKIIQLNLLLSLRDTTSWSPTPRSDLWPYELPDLWFVFYSSHLKVLAKFGLCSNCSQKFDECSLVRARKIFASARMLGFSLNFPAYLHLQNKNWHWKQCFPYTKMGNIGETCARHEGF